jgi:hypothetical protein
MIGLFMEGIMRRSLVLLGLLLVAACAAAGPRFGAVAGNLPPVPEGAARVYFYRALEPYEGDVPTTAFLNGVAVGVTQAGAVLYRDVAPGTYAISVASDAAFPNQFKSATLAAGATLYVRVETLESWACGGKPPSDCNYTTFALSLIPAETAQQEMQDLEFLRG